VTFLLGFFAGRKTLTGQIGVYAENFATASIEEPDLVQYQYDINTASAEELCEIPGIGESLANRIIDYRAQNGPFQSVEELDNVSGIGPKLLENIRKYIKVGE